MRFRYLPRDEFLADYWTYSPGEHVTVTAPTQCGKTTFLFQLLAATDTSWCRIPPVFMCAKPTDPVPAAWLPALGYREIRSWPPPWKPFAEKPAGYGLWPRHLRGVDPEFNYEHLRGQFTPAYEELFWKGRTIAVVDETYFHCAKLDVNGLMERHWTQGASGGAALWDATQKPSGTQTGTISTFRYNSSEHTFLGGDPDKRNRDRFGEIGGVDPQIVAEAVKNLRQFEWLYIRRTGARMCIVGP